MTQQELLVAIASAKTQQQAAEAYAQAFVGKHPITWLIVNEAIQARWPKGLERVKKKAWRIIYPNNRKETQ